MNQVHATIGDQAFVLSAHEIEKQLRAILPEPLGEHYVVVGGRRFPRRMIGVDTNILVYAHRRDAVFHEGAVIAIRGLAEGVAAWAIPWPCLHEFLAIVTHPRIYDPPELDRKRLGAS